MIRLIQNEFSINKQTEI